LTGRREIRTRGRGGGGRTTSSSHMMAMIKGVTPIHPTLVMCYTVDPRFDQSVMEGHSTMPVTRYECLLLCHWYEISVT